MSTVTITISIELPEGASVSIGGATAAPQATQTAPAFVAPASTPGAVHELWPAGECPKHHKPWKPGNFGAYCSARDEGTPKGYCILKPGDLFQGKVAA